MKLHIGCRQRHLGMNTRIRNLLLRVFNKWKHIINHHTILANDTEMIANLKENFNHSEREFIHRKNIVVVDSLYCHAVPGTIEVTLSELHYLLKNKNSIGNKLLNFGGGTGQVSSLLEKIGFDVFNLDIAVDVSTKKNIKFDLNSDDELPFDEGSFDFVLCQEVIEHIENPWKLFRMINKVLKVDGYLVLTTPNIQSEFSKQKFLKKGYFHWFTPDCFSYHINALPMWEIELIANKIGFEIEKIKGNGEYYFSKNSEPPREKVVMNNECLIFIIKKKYNYYYES